MATYSTVFAHIGRMKRQMYLARKRGARSMPQTAEPRIVTYTTAPAEYDGFGTRIEQVMGTYNGHIMRRVTTPERHVRWQRDRYGSGLFSSWSEQDWQQVQGEIWFQKQFIPALGGAPVCADTVKEGAEIMQTTPKATTRKRTTTRKKTTREPKPAAQVSVQVDTEALAQSTSTEDWLLQGQQPINEADLPQEGPVFTLVPSPELVALTQELEEARSHLMTPEEEIALAHDQETTDGSAVLTGLAPTAEIKDTDAAILEDALDVLHAQEHMALAQDTTQLNTPVAEARVTAPLPETLTRPQYSFTPTTCFVCGDTTTVKKEHNGRCADCWAFFRKTGTDRTPAELVATKGVPVEDILHKGLLRGTETQATPRPSIVEAIVSKGVEAVKETLARQPGAFAASQTVVTPTTARTARPKAARTSTPRAQGDKPAHTCACGTVFYGNSVSSQCYGCWKKEQAAKKTARANTITTAAR